MEFLDQRLNEDSEGKYNDRRITQKEANCRDENYPLAIEDLFRSSYRL
jgi:hypothetical protein